MHGNVSLLSFPFIIPAHASWLTVPWRVVSSTVVQMGKEGASFLLVCGREWSVAYGWESDGAKPLTKENLKYLKSKIKGASPYGGRRDQQERHAIAHQMMCGHLEKKKEDEWV